MNALQFQKKLLSMQENMMNFALMLTANRDDAQDLMQDTTLKVLDNQEKFVDNINFKGWVLTVMRNIFINNYHKIVRTQTVVDQGVDLYNLDVVNDSGFDSPDGAYQIKEITKAIMVTSIMKLQRSYVYLWGRLKAVSSSLVRNCRKS